MSLRVSYLIVHFYTFQIFYPTNADKNNEIVSIGQCIDMAITIKKGWC